MQLFFVHPKFIDPMTIEGNYSKGVLCVASGVFSVKPSVSAGPEMVVTLTGLRPATLLDSSSS